MRAEMGRGLRAIIVGAMVLGSVRADVPSQNSDSQHRTTTNSDMFVAAPSTSSSLTIDVLSATTEPAVPQTSVPTYFDTEWTIQSGAHFGTVFSASYSLPTAAPAAIADQGNLTLALLWTNAGNNDPVDSTNTYALTNVTYSCNNPGESCQWAAGSSGETSLSLDRISANATDSSSITNLFLCFATGTEFNQTLTAMTCESYSEFFEISAGTAITRREVILDGRGLPIRPNATMSVTQATSFITPIASGTGAIGSNPSASTIYGSTVTVAPTTSPSSSSISAQATAVGPASKKSGLGIGPIIGIAIAGAFVLILALLVAFFCFRRRRRNQQRRPEQVLLTSGMHNMSRDLISEKNSPSGESGGPMLASILETRPSSGPYDHLASEAPYSGPVGKRTTLQTDASLSANAAVGSSGLTRELTRGVSDASAAPVSPRSTRRRDVDGHSSYSGEAEHEPYRDTPHYGDVRQPYPGVQAPFLSEPGMTDEELSRLEEEERAIDEAIAEAERRR